jgi:hypothetical protein
MGSLTSDGDHLSTDGSGHLRAGGQRRTQRAPGGPRSCPATGVRTRPSKNAATTPAAYGVLYSPPVRPPAREKPWMWRTRIRHDRRPCGGWTVTPRPNGRRQRRRRRQSRLGQEPGTRQLSASAASRPHVAEVHLLRVAGEPLSSLECWRKKRVAGPCGRQNPGSARLLPSEDDEHP